LGREHATRIDVRQPFANRRQKAPVLTQRRKLGCADEHGRGFASLQHNDCIARIVHAFHELFGSLRKLGGGDRRLFATHARKLAAAPDDVELPCRLRRRQDR
jgi:hypothetical protein